MHRRLIRVEAGLWAWMNYARRHRAVVITAWMVVLIVSLFQARHLGVNADTSQLISDKLDYQQEELAFQEHFPGLDERVLVLVRSETQDEAERFSSLLVDRLVVRDDAIEDLFAGPVHPFFQQNGLLYQDVDDLSGTLARLSRAAPLIESLNRDPSLDSFFRSLERAADRDVSNPAEADLLDKLYHSVADTIDSRINGNERALSWRELFETEDDPGPNQVLINITPVLDYSTIRPARHVQEAIEHEVDTIRDETGLEAEAFITGTPILRSDELRTVSEGIGIALSASAIMVTILLLIALRSFLMAAVTVVLISVSIIVTGGFTAAFIGDLNLVSVAFAVLMVGLGVDFSIHLALHAQSERSHGRSPRAALYRTSREIGGALALTAPTTALAFFAFAPTPFTGMTQLGIIAGVGVLIAFLAATSLLPIALTFLPVPKKLTHGPSEKRNLFRDYSTITLGFGVVILALMALPLMGKVRFDADPMALRDPNSTSVLAFNELFKDDDTLPYRLNVLAEDIETGRVLADALADAPEIGSAITLASFIPEDQYEKLDLIDYARVGLDFALAENPPPPRPTDNDQIAGSTLLREALEDQQTEGARRLATSLENLEDLGPTHPEFALGIETDILEHWPYQLAQLRSAMNASVIEVESLPQTIQDRYLALDGRVRVEAIPAEDVRDQDRRREFVDAAGEIAPGITGPARNVLRSGEVISKAMVQATLTALILVCLLLYVLVRRIGLVLAMLIPLALAAILTSATGVLIGMPYNFANVIVLPLLVGVGVDSGIHLALRADKMKRATAVIMTTTPRAVLFSALTTIASFGSLSLSGHRGTATMGGLLVVAIFWTLACTIFVLPTLMNWLGRQRPNSKLD